jgi:hypothetical protein
MNKRREWNKKVQETMRQYGITMKEALVMLKKK